MSSEHDYTAPRSPLPPPPPPPAPVSPRLPVPGQTPLRRIAVQPPLITTALAPPQGVYLHAQTPLSATSLSVPFSPYAPSPSTYAASPVSSPMAMRNSSSVPYNPQQWGRHGPVGGAYLPHSTAQTPTVTSRPREVTGMEASMPSPPPPYSPGQNQNLSQAVNSSPHMSGNSFAPPQNPPTSAQPSEYVPSAQSRPVSGFDYSRPSSMLVPTSATSVTSNPQFPPPPPRNGKERSVSRDKSHSKFSLSAFRNRGSDHSPGPSAIESLRINTSEALSRPPGSPGPRASQTFLSSAFPERRWSPESQSPIRPPASRRAASAGALSLAADARTPIENSPAPLQGNWAQALPLPPPPPGPPPSSSRSQSLGPSSESYANRQRILPSAPPTRRPGLGTLTPIPPTPVGWQEDQAQSRSRSPAARGLQIDTSPQAIRSGLPPAQTSESENVSISSGPTASTSNSTSTLYRSPPKRDPSSRGIRERRSESRAARERVEPNNNPWAQDMEAASAKPTDLNLVLPGTPDASLSRRGAVTKSTPRSGGIRSPRNSQSLEEPGSSNSTPRVDSARRAISGAFAPTPPFSPGTDSFDHRLVRKAPAAIPPKALPTPPLHYFGDEHAISLTNTSEHVNRSTSQTSCASDSRPEESSASTPRPTARDSFAQASIERHRRFIEKEIAAQTDQDRLELFAEFIVAESRLRRDRYSAAFDTMACDILDLTRDLWRSYNSSTGRRSATPSAQSVSVPSGRRSQASTVGESPDTRFSNSMPTTAASPASSVTNFTPHTEPNSPSSATSQRGREQAWNNNYQPCLSPIPSMAMSTVPDEDSRGRSASRWWEASTDRASSGHGSRRLARSKRESKYMGLPKEARESLQWEDQASPAYPTGSSNQQTYGPNEYPPEKVGTDEEGQRSSSQSYQYYPSSVPATPDPHKQDVSRLVTLPPPYPRHHPAVNNNHPDLASIRNNLRTLSELEEVKITKEGFNEKTGTRREQESTSLADRRKELHYNIQGNVRNGIMSFADAAKAEADFEALENKRAQDLVQNIFDTFQTEVANPLHALFCERITKVTASMDYLKVRLSNDAQVSNPNQTQEEGDEQPELLEMLTLLKWLFEAREQLYKEMFELEDERNDLYRDIIVLPYIQTKNEQKVKEATAFFQRDAQDRKVVFEKEILKRYEDLMNVIEANVTRGVEAQLSAFWDIAPGLLTIVQKVPQRLNGFDILIPPQEYEENPAYHDFPMQYLYSLLAHAGRSAYQFIESQINLLCLLHEVKTGVMTAGSRLLETQRILEGEDGSSVDNEMRAIRQDEEARLTDDLKDKVGLVESQWGEALGKGLEDCKTRVEVFLVHQDGWDDSLKE
ncbi:uncharacterized protein BDR25DRAFT_260424 [Lindgomyces ingoldianus]|uniref:Uncharacterized protein n=1 Tax=Lindgomyces ingoldianus TaxID=673940 RepID=A0ACB6R0J7_9PLEO|nr:uncharacterized protein BDR25DRAFT_260424 [Lindgomyces ingoldianus]KAF2471845.1 hypothetical protein BDR25DRAFT_260424 [Lindgomyces ingoldianus]